MLKVSFDAHVRQRAAYTFSSLNYRIYNLQRTAMVLLTSGHEGLDVRQYASTVQKSEYASRQLDDQIIDMSAGQPGPSFLPIDKIALVAKKVLDPNTGDPYVLQYAPRRGFPSFRASLAQFLTGHYGYGVDADNLMATAGVSHALGLLCNTLASPGATVLVESPTYFLAAGIFRSCYLNPVAIPTDEDGLQIDALEAWLASHPSPALLYTIPVHNNPRGTLLPSERRKRLVALAQQYGFYVLADEVYQLLTFPGAPSPPPPMRSFDTQRNEAGSRIISVSSFSKILAPGMRLGWVEAAPDIIARLVEDGVLVSGGCIAPLASAMAWTALKDGLVQQQIDTVVRPGLAERCSALCEGLRQHLPPGCSFLQPSGGYFVWVTLPPPVNGKELLQTAVQHRVRFTPGSVCGSPVDNALRLSFSFYTPDELREGAARLGRAVKEILEKI